MMLRTSQNPKSTALLRAYVLAAVWSGNRQRSPEDIASLAANIVINNMADDGDDNIFVYLGGEQEVPRRVTHAIIDPSVKNVRRDAFRYRQRLVSVIFHDGVEAITTYAFCGCISLRRIKLLGVKKIGEGAFRNCTALSDVEFGDRLETIGKFAFYGCDHLRSIKLLSVTKVRSFAFGNCDALTDVEFGVDLETIGTGSFENCPKLHRVTIPLKYYLLPFGTDYQRCTHFDGCRSLRTVELVGVEEIKTTTSLLLLQSWKDEMNEEIDRINQELPDTDADEKAITIRLWIRSVIKRMKRYKAEHNRLLKEHMTQLELAIWKAKLDEKSTREERRITSGADIIIKNVLPFLKLA